MNEWVVVVDDETLSLMNVRNLLGSQDIRVSCLRSGKDLLKFIKKNEPDVILLDILMPGMDGFETLAQLRDYEDSVGRAHIPVIFLTGEDDSETEQLGFQAGAADFIHKPFDQNILVSRIRKTIEDNKTINNLTEEASLDKLTGFLNKSSGTQRISKLCSTKVGALMILDLDNFKLVNDLYGHATGDQILVSFADVVRNNIRSEDIVSRVGGDEFMGFFCDVTEEIAVASLATRFNEQFYQKVKGLMGDGFDIPLGISVGVALAPEHSTDYSVLFKYADKAMYKIKQSGKHGYSIHVFGEDFEVYENIDKELERLTRIIDERSDEKKALLLSQDEFTCIFHYLQRLDKTYMGKSKKLLMVLSKDADTETEDFNEASMQLAALIQKQLRPIDIVLQNKQNEFLVVFPNSDTEYAKDKAKMIVALWEEEPISAGTKIVYTTDKSR